MPPPSAFKDELNLLFPFSAVRLWGLDPQHPPDYEETPTYGKGHGNLGEHPGHHSSGQRHLHCPEFPVVAKQRGGRQGKHCRGNQDGAWQQRQAGRMGTPSF